MNVLIVLHVRLRNNFFFAGDVKNKVGLTEILEDFSHPNLKGVSLERGHLKHSGKKENF